MRNEKYLKKKRTRARLFRLCADYRDLLRGPRRPFFVAQSRNLIDGDVGYYVIYTR